MPASNILESGANRGALENLVRVLQFESPLALVGAGMSIPSGFPSWTKLVDDMDKRSKGLDDDYRRTLSADQDLLWRAGEYRQIMGEDTFRKMMETTFGRKPRMTKADPAVLFAQLPFRHFITTNYDDVIPTALKMAGRDVPRLLNWCLDDDVRDFIFALRDSRSGQKSILHLHGHHSRPDSIILSDNDYTERYVRSFGTANKLFAIFSTERVVFAGFSLNDPDLMALMREVNATMRPKESRHFAIMGILDPLKEKLERNRLRNRFGVEPVFYDARRDHSGLGEIVEFLHQSMQVASELEADVTPIDARIVNTRETTIRTREIDPEDPEKNQWGGSPEANYRRIGAKVKTLEPDWFEVTMEVRSTRPKPHPLTGKVIFHLHPSLIPKVRAVPVHRGVARLVVESYGAYTVGVETDNRKNHLELDLAEIKRAPLMFRMN